MGMLPLRACALAFYASCIAFAFTPIAKKYQHQYTIILFSILLHFFQN
jgi:hypothetical protein